MLDNSILGPLIDPNYEFIQNGTYYDYDMTAVEKFYYYFSETIYRYKSYKNWLDDCETDLFYSDNKRKGYYTKENYMKECSEFKEGIKKKGFI